MAPYSQADLHSVTAAYLHEGKDDGQEYDSEEAVNKYAESFGEFFDTTPGRKIFQQGKNGMPRIRGCVSDKIQRVAEDMYKGATIALQRADQGKGMTETALRITQGMLYLLCYIGATLIAISLSLLQCVFRVICAVAQVAWIIIKKTTGFVLGVLYSTAKNPITWGAVMSCGIFVAAAANPLVGGLMALIGAIGTYITG